MCREPIDSIMEKTLDAKKMVEVWKQSYLDVRAKIEASGRDARWEFDRRKLFDKTDYAGGICQELHSVVQVSTHTSHKCTYVHNTHKHTHTTHMHNTHAQHTCTHIHTCMYTHAYTHAHTHMHIHTTHTHTHTHTHTCTYTQHTYTRTQAVRLTI